MTPAVGSPYLDVAALAPLAGKRFATRQRIEGAFSGRHASRLQGGGGEFVDYREYSGGEDLRRLDWKVLARTGRAYVRLHQDETNLLCTIALDSSGSMSFAGRTSGGQSKLEYCQFLATAMSQIVVQGQDQVGLALLGDQLSGFLPPAGTASHLAHVQEQIATLEATASDEMSDALNALFQASRRRGVLVLLTDFLMADLEEVFAKIRQFRHNGWEVLALHIVHPEEEHLPEGNSFRFTGLEGEPTITCSPHDFHREYDRRFREFLVQVRKFALMAGCDYRLLSTAEPYIQALQSLLVERTG